MDVEPNIQPEKLRQQRRESYAGIAGNMDTFSHNVENSNKNKNQKALSQEYPQVIYTVLQKDSYLERRCILGLNIDGHCIRAIKKKSTNAWNRTRLKRDTEDQER